MKKALLFTCILILSMILAACGTSEWQKERGLGKEAAEADDLDKAVKHYEKAAELNSSKAIKEELDIVTKARDEKQEVERKQKEEQQKKEQEQLDAIENLPIDQKVVEKFEIVDSAISVNDELKLVKESGFAWDETTYVSNYALDMFKAMKEVFTDSSINKVLVVMNADLIDNKGNESPEEVVSFSYTRDTFESINYDNFIKLAFGEEWRIFEEADSYSIHPALFGGIEEKYLEQLLPSP